MVLVVVEGVSGAGKTTLMRSVKRGWLVFEDVGSELMAKGFPVGIRATDFVEKEIMLREFARSERYRVLLERGMKVLAEGDHLLNLAYAKTRKEFGITNFYERYKREYLRRRSRIPKPRAYVRVVVEPEIAYERLRESGKFLPLEFIERLVENLEEVHELEPEIPVYCVENNDESGLEKFKELLRRLSGGQ